jgi:hypothetical protein
MPAASAQCGPHPDGFFMEPLWHIAHAIPEKLGDRSNPVLMELEHQDGKPKKASPHHGYVERRRACPDGRFSPSF